MSVLVSPSLLSADFSILAQEVASIDKAGADWIHWDVMDGQFVPNLTFGPPLIKALRFATQKPFDVHLMIQNAEQSLEQYAQAGANLITVHAEAVTHLDRTLSQIRSLGCKAGVALNPGTHESVLEYLQDKLDLVLIMSVNPGFGGQSFLSSQLRKVEKIAAWARPLGIDISVDGGVNDQHAKALVSAGASVLVAGNFVFQPTQKARAERIQQLRQAC